MSLVEIFGNMNDPRLERNRRHRLVDIMVIAVSAFICGAETWTEVEEFGECKQSWFKGFLELPNGIPSHDTFGRVFGLLNPGVFEQSFLEWVNSIKEGTLGEVVAVDGKTLKRSYDRANGKSAVHMVSAWASRNQLVLGQVKTDEKSNEITAIPRLLEKLMLAGCIVTMDAMGCQKEIAKQIIGQQANYVLALKGNQGQLHEDVKLYLDHEIEKAENGLRFQEQIEGDHGRIEVRRCWATETIDWLEGGKQWSGLKSICAVECERTVNDHTSRERRYFISSLPADEALLASAVRQHWGVENRLHWVLDVAFREDECRVRQGNSAENMAVLRHMALNLLKQEKTLKLGVKSRRKSAGWNEAYLLKVLGLSN